MRSTYRNSGPYRFLVCILLSVCLQACAGLRPGFETPTVTISSIRTLPTEGAFPKFEIGLHVVNPNRDPLKLDGVAYTVSLEGQELIKGVDNDLPIIEGYGEGDITVTATPNLLAGIRLITDLMSGPRDTFRYSLEAKLDVGAFTPPIRVRDEGEISLKPGT